MALKKRTVTILLIAAIPLALLLYVAGVLAYGTLTDWQPEEAIQIDLNGEATAVGDASEFDFLIWNIGYGGLGAESDFFYDGGKTSIVSKSLSDKYFEGIRGSLEAYANTDFVLLQEVDQYGDRSHKRNQFEELSAIWPSHAAGMGINYKVNFVPVPFTKPMGKVNGGLASWSRYEVTEATRYQFPGNYSWPNRIFFLDRCFLVYRLALSNGKELVVINTHNSAYDDGTLKAGQMAYLKTFITSEYEAGNYVVVGGDWNQCPPGFELMTFAREAEQENIGSNIEFDYLPEDWRWIYDPTVATNRKLAYAYDPSKTFTTVIDFYLVSPNVQVTEVKGVQLNFQHSDHQPVYMKVKLDGFEQAAEATENDEEEDPNQG